MRSLLLYLVPIVTITSSIEHVTSNKCLSESNDNDYPQTQQSDLYRGQQTFTIALLDAMNELMPHENIFFSPYSTYHALLLAYFGARNDTESELADVLNLQWAKNKNHVREAYRTEKTLRTLQSSANIADFCAANKMYFSLDVSLNDCLKDLFPDELETVNFKSDPDGCRKEINGWVANVTRNELPEVLNEGDIDSETNLVLTNAAYFRGKWESKFDPKDTTMDVFYTTPNKQTFVNMMHKTGVYSLAVDEYLRAYILEMPYLTGNESESESEMSMIIILPSSLPDSLEGVLNRLNPESLSRALKGGIAREINVSLPRFEFEQNIQLLPVFEKIGVKKLFHSGADLSGFSESKKISLGDAKHVAKIKVDEEGSTAAASTVLFTFRSARPLEPTKFECNHPFLFLIYDRRSQAVLFAGIYRDPLINPLELRPRPTAQTLLATEATNYPLTNDSIDKEKLQLNNLNDANLLLDNKGKNKILVSPSSISTFPRIQPFSNDQGCRRMYNSWRIIHTFLRV